MGFSANNNINYAITGLNDIKSYEAQGQDKLSEGRQKVVTVAGEVDHLQSVISTLSRSTQLTSHSSVENSSNSPSEVKFFDSTRENSRSNSISDVSSDVIRQLDSSSSEAMVERPSQQTASQIQAFAAKPTAQENTEKKGFFKNLIKSAAESLRTIKQARNEKKTGEFLNQFNSLQEKIDQSEGKPFDPKEFKEFASTLNKISSKMNEPFFQDVIKPEQFERTKKKVEDNNLKFILAAPKSISNSKFQAFVKSQYATENTDFYLAVEKYLKSPSLEKAKALESSYIANDSENVINISGSLREQVIDAIKAGDLAAIKEPMLTSQKEIYSLLIRNFLSPFLEKDDNRAQFNKELGVH